MQRFMSSRVSSIIRNAFCEKMAIIRPISIGLPGQIAPTLLAPPPSRQLKIYTGTGDKGTSGLFTGERRPKTDPVFQALGTVDELSSVIGVSLAILEEHQAAKQPVRVSVCCGQLEQIQQRLQMLASAVATPRSCGDGRPRRYARVNFPLLAADELERWIDVMTEELPPLRQFILPSGGPPGASLHLARAVCRRAERSVVALNGGGDGGAVEDSVLVYLNRLSDYLFTAARYVSAALGYRERHFVAPPQE